MKGVKKSILAAFVSFTMVFASATPALAADELDIQFCYDAGAGFTFEKISHVDTGTEQADGIVDYTGSGSIEIYMPGFSEIGNGDTGQSYSYAVASYGDWVYIGTMYGGLSASNIIDAGLGDLDPEITAALINVLYNGNMYTGEYDGGYAGGILVKFNVVTGESEILMSKETNGLIPTFRDAVVLNNKLYFVGMVVDTTSGLTATEISTAIAIQSGFPVVYEIDPANDDAMTCVLDCVDSSEGVDTYREMVAENFFMSTRAITTYSNGTEDIISDDSLVAAGLDPDGVYVAISDDPSAGDDSFSVILTNQQLVDLGASPAYYRDDATGGGGIYQVIEYNEELYVVVCVGTTENKNPETQTMEGFAIVKGTLAEGGDATNAADWTWSNVVGDTDLGADYTFGIDPERYSSVAATLEVYDGYLWIGEYNDSASGLMGFILYNQFTTMATNIEQSINLYRMDSSGDIELIVGDATSMFPDGGISGLGSGYTTNMTQYTWQTIVYDDKLYVSTYDATTFLEPIAQFTNGDLLEMSKEEWISQINYIRVLVELLFDSSAEEAVVESDADVDANADIDEVSTDDESAVDIADINDESVAVEVIDQAVEDAQQHAEEASISTLSVDSDEISEVVLDEDQLEQLVSDLMEGTIEGDLKESDAAKLIAINNILDSLEVLIDESGLESHEDFLSVYSVALADYEEISEYLPENITALLDLILNVANEDIISDIIASLPYMVDSEAGFDIYEITSYDDGSVSVETVTTDGFGDAYSHGLRSFVTTPDYLMVGTASPFYGTQLWRTASDTTAHALVFDITEGGSVVSAIVGDDDSAQTTSAGETPLLAYKEGEVVTLTAVAEDGYEFVGFEVMSGDITLVESADNAYEAQFVMHGYDVEIKAVFEAEVTPDPEPIPDPDTPSVDPDDSDDGTTDDSAQTDGDEEGSDSSALAQTGDSWTTIMLITVMATSSLVLGFYSFLRLKKKK